MTQLWLARHGQTDWNVEGRWQGQAAPMPLNAAGRAQAEALAACLSGLSFEALFSSDLTRARETAEIIGRRIGLPVTVDPRLREINLGAWEGMLGTDVARLYPAELAERGRDPVYARAPGAESAAEVAARVWAAADDIARAHPTGPVLVISHGLALATLICRARGQPLARVYEVVPANTHLEVVEWIVS